MSLLQTLGARYDNTVLAPPEPVTQAPVPHDAAAWQVLQAWCAAGSGPGGSPLLLPNALPQVDLRFSAATLQGPGAAALAQLLCLERDGSLQLLACGGAVGRLALRLRTKLNDALWWRRRQLSDPWDSGTLRSADTGRVAGFRPRRATLIVAQDLSATDAQALMHVLADTSPHYAHPVRLLLLNAPKLGTAVTAVHCG